MSPTGRPPADWPQRLAELLERRPDLAGIGLAPLDLWAWSA